MKKRKAVTYNIMEAEKRYMDKSPRTIGRRHGGKGSSAFADNRPDSIVQAVTDPVRLPGDEDDELLQGRFAEPVRTKNETGMPDNLKAGIEDLSGFALDDVQVHYNSDKPAAMKALAYTQGCDIHVAPGQERHLPHEAWHVVQQMAGRVQPTTEIGGLPVNDSSELEREADAMGARANSY